ncbi:TolC family protein [candidate division KSB1 bacterium]|nr:TolC family protein [candidate division KSB1 bacterium]RQW02392.1 MAG: TolC family protein [candidate division KSB1 bacterium]
MKKHTQYILLYLCCISSILSAQNGSSLEDYLEQALTANTEIRKSQLAVEAAALDARMSRALPDPSFMIEGRGVPLEISRFGETREWMFMLEQMFPAPGSLKHLEQKAQFATDIQEALLRAVKNDITRQVKVIFYQLGYLDVALKSNADQLALLAEFEKIARSKYTVGRTGQQDLLQIEMEQARLLTARLKLEENLATETAEMNRILRRPLNETITTASLQLPAALYTASQLASIQEQFNPSLIIARLLLAVAENDGELARASKRPAFKVMGGYMVMNEMENTLMGRVGMTLPFMPWSSIKSRAAYEKSQVVKNKTEIEYQTLKDQLAVQLLAAVQDLSTLYNQIELYDQRIIPASEQTVSLSMAGYQADSVDFFSLIQYAREHLNNELLRDELVAMYWQKRAQLEYIVGTSLDEVTK